jgi:predicted nucleic acid-binding protein
MKEEIFVLDASVIVKWFSKEENSDKSVEIRNRFVNREVFIVCPDLVLYEVANALRYNKVLEEKDIKDAIESIYDLEIDIIVPTKEIMTKAIEFAKKFNITVYDAIYVSLADILNAKLITADEILIKKCKTGFVISLKDVSFS